MAYKFEQEGVLSQGADAAGEAQDEHDPSDDDEEPHGVEAPQVRDGWQVGQDALRERMWGRGRGNKNSGWVPAPTAVPSTSLPVLCDNKDTLLHCKIWLLLNC